MDDTLQYQDPSWPHLSHNYQILMGFIENSSDDSRFNANYASRLIVAFDSPDSRERKSLAKLVLAIGKRSPDDMREIFKMTMQALACYRDGSRSHFCVGPALLVTMEYVLPRLPSLRDQSLVPIYKSHIIPLIKSDFFTHFQELFLPVAEIFVSTGLKPIVTATWSSIVHSFPLSDIQKSAALLNLLTTTLLKTGQEELKSNVKTIIGVYTRCATWGNLKLCKASAQIWNRPELLRRIHDEDGSILPLVFPVILQASKNPWQGTIAQTLGEILAVMSRMNPAVCQNLRNQKRVPEISERVKMWAILAKYTAREDPQLCAGDWKRALQKSAMPLEYEARPQPGLLVRADTGPTPTSPPHFASPSSSPPRAPGVAIATARAGMRMKVFAPL
jgi:hypothetical protein